MAIEREYEQIFICEDDINFTDIDTFKKSLAEFYEDDIHWDMLIIAGNNHHPFKVVKESYIQISNCQCGTGYVVKKHYYQDLLNNFKEALFGLQNEAEHYYRYALDRYWCKLQEKDDWFMITPYTVTQTYSYSDIEKVWVEYSWMMLNSE
jgi:GR25 family glycosyltransferase involved in LPS biosynthesis